jgi:hypothetical protein
MATLKPMSQTSEPMGSTGFKPNIATPGQEGNPEMIQQAIAAADEAGVEKAIGATPTATPPGAKPAPASKFPMQKSPPQVNEEDEEDDEDEDKEHMKEEDDDKNDKEHMKEEDENEDEDEDEDEDKKHDMKEDLNALFHGENLSEAFMKKAATIFEAAVAAKVAKVEEKLQEQYAEILEEVSEQLKEEMTTKVDDYLNYVVEEWVKENELAIESGLRSELTEDFIAGLRNLFAEHYIDIPEEKVNVVEELSSHVVELENKLNEEISNAVELTKQLKEYAKREILTTVCEGLTSTQTEKMKSLSEGVEFVSEEDYAESLATLRESYFPTKSNVINKRIDEEVDVVEQTESAAKEQAAQRKIADPVMAAYVNSISRTVIK